MTTISIDAECNAEFFWGNARRESQHCPIPRFGAWIASRSDEPITMDTDEAAVVTSWLAEIPGWSDPEYPTYAPHPLIVGGATTATLESLNLLDNPTECGGKQLGIDGHGNQLWLFGKLVANRRMDDIDGNGETAHWSSDVAGWNYDPETDAVS
jgi:hypothetical protein